MCSKKRVLVFEFHQETNTFNPITSDFERFHPTKTFEGAERLEGCIKAGGCVAGGVAAIEEAGGEVIPALFMHASSGGRVNDEVLAHLCHRLKNYIETIGEFDAIYAALHGATCTVSCNDACGELLAFLRSLAPDKVIAASFDLHANITEKVLKNADFVCGYNTYPHVDFFQTGYRAAKFCMDKLSGATNYMAAAGVNILIPPAGYTNLDGPFKDLIDQGKAMVESGDISDFTVFPVQPWLDIDTIASRVVTIGPDPEKAKACADKLAAGLLALREDVQPPLFSVDEIIDIAEKNDSGKPVILAESADSPNGGCVGDSPVVALHLKERGSKVRTCMFVVDPAAAKLAHSLGVGAKAEFSIGAGYTKGMPGPFRAEGTVRSLHDGYFRTVKYSVAYLGPSAVVSFGNIDVLLCDHGGATGSPMIFRGFGMEPLHYDLVVVKANTSFRVPYSTISDLIYVADTPGAGASNLKQLQWEKLPKGMYPFDLPEGYEPEKAKLW